MERNPEGSGAAAPVVAAASASVAAEKPVEVEAKPRRLPAWAEQFQAVIDACDISPEQLGEYRAETNGAAKTLGAKGYGREPILAGMREYIGRFAGAELTPSALAKWVPRLVDTAGQPLGPTPTANGPPSLTPNGRARTQASADSGVRDADLERWQRKYGSPQPAPGAGPPG